MKARHPRRQPRLFIESETLYSVKGEVPDDPDFLVPMGVANVVREGQGLHDRRLVAHDARRARGGRRRSRRRASTSRSIDLRSLRPLDEDTIVDAGAPRRTARSSPTKAGPTAASAPRSPTASSASRSTSSTRRSSRHDARRADAVQREARAARACRRRRASSTRCKRTSSTEAERSDHGESSRHAEALPHDEGGAAQRWHKKEGDAVAVDDLLAEVETDKATMEFRAVRQGHAAEAPRPRRQPGEARSAGRDPRQPGRGRLRARRRRCRGASIRRPAAAPAARPPTPTPAARRDAATATGDRDLQPPLRAAARPPDAHEPTRRSRARLPLRAQGRARARDRPRAASRAPGPHGRIVARDLDRALPRPAVPRPGSRAAPPARRRRAEVRPLSMMRKTIARRLTESKQNVPHFYLTIDVDAAPISRLREQINAELAASAPRNGAAEAAAPPRCQSTICHQGLRHRARPRARVQRAVHARGDPHPPARRHLGRGRHPRRPRHAGGAQRRQEERRRASPTRSASSPARAKSKKLEPEEMSDGTFSSRTSACSASTRSPRSSTRPRARSSRSARFGSEPVVRRR